ncbi:DUF4873 domain-containing protein [Jidongwangia harbinensis]|uniref:DUF4873 domain-containing protein n=1 Tax=Jidongwangia harbinensis TaxID=2878561 RepID=UPI001CD98641|nr:DUF4873 domain-containing protein [Jidongwangia harbinensis]MCA2214284.1 DUF4873 domain-containing protein [Jidongwangia harbinensis]
MTDPAEEYRGPATVRVGTEIRAVTVRLSVTFEPVEGRYRWAGRTSPDPALVARVRSGAREAEVRLPGGTGRAARIGEPDPWGGVRLSGVGPPPWTEPATAPGRLAP